MLLPRSGFTAVLLIFISALVFGGFLGSCSQEKLTAAQAAVEKAQGEAKAAKEELEQVKMSWRTWTVVIVSIAVVCVFLVALVSWLLGMWSGSAALDALKRPTPGKDG